MTDAAFSRRMLALTRSKQPSHEEEGARAYLQKRLEVYSRIIFWAFVALRVAEALLYWTVPRAKPLYYPYIVLIGVAGLAIMAGCWRGLLVRHTLSLRALKVFDTTYTFSGGLVFAATAVLAPNRHEVGYICMVYTCFIVFTRALIVPSTGRFTLVTSLLALGPVVIAAAVIAPQQEVPGVAFFLGAFTFAGFAVAIASSGSRLIYGLQRRVNEQMKLGQYTLETKIGEGGTGAVYRARHPLLRRPTALKLLRPEQFGADTLLRFEREVQHMSQLTHPNTVAVFDYGYSADGIFYYEMEYLDGLDLETLIEIDGPQAPGRVVKILVQVCGALQEAHERRIIHRDIKPGNVMLCRRGGLPDVAKVLDFGLARDIDRDAGTKRIAGTPAYLAPEAITAPDEIGPAADLYGLGCVAYFLLTGQRVFWGANARELCEQHVRDEPRPMSTHRPVPPMLESVITQCLAKDPSARPISAHVLAEQLQALQLDATWTDEEAEAWWAAYANAPSARASMPSMTITIDLGERSLPRAEG